MFTISYPSGQYYKLKSCSLYFAESELNGQSFLLVAIGRFTVDLTCQHQEGDYNALDAHFSEHQHVGVHLLIMSAYTTFNLYETNLFCFLTQSKPSNKCTHSLTYLKSTSNATVAYCSTCQQLADVAKCLSIVLFGHSRIVVVRDRIIMVLPLYSCERYSTKGLTD